MYIELLNKGGGLTIRYKIRVFIKGKVVVIRREVDGKG